MSCRSTSNCVAPSAPLSAVCSFGKAVRVEFQPLEPSPLKDLDRNLTLGAVVNADAPAVVDGVTGISSIVTMEVDVIRSEIEATNESIISAGVEAIDEATADKGTEEGVTAALDDDIVAVDGSAAVGAGGSILVSAFGWYSMCATVSNTEE